MGNFIGRRFPFGAPQGSIPDLPPLTDTYSSFNVGENATSIAGTVADIADSEPLTLPEFRGSLIEFPQV